MNPFIDAFSRLNENEAFKWDSYFSAYSDIFAPYLSRPNLCLLEIGVSKGGSLDMWSNVFHKTTTIVGIDIDPSCLDAKHPDNVYVHIVDQTDEQMLTQLALIYGGFDIIIDDGAHTDTAIKSSLLTLWPYLRDNGVYLVEDIHGTFWDDAWSYDASFMNFIANEIMAMQSIGSRNRITSVPRLPNLERVSMHWSIAALSKSSLAANPKYSLKAANRSIKPFSRLDD